MSQSNSTPHPSQQSGGSGNGSTPPSPMSSLMRFFRAGNAPGSPGGVAGLTGGASASAPSTPDHAHITRGLSDPTPFAFSPAFTASTHRPHSLSMSGSSAPAMQRARSLEADPFRLGDSAVGPLSLLPTSSSGQVISGGPTFHAGGMPSSPGLRAFSIQQGFPVAEAAGRKKSNGFLEMLAKSDSFMSND